LDGSAKEGCSIVNTIVGRCGEGDAQLGMNNKCEHKESPQQVEATDQCRLILAGILP
jgi:hypothetical protein